MANANFVKPVTPDVHDSIVSSCIESEKNFDRKLRIMTAYDMKVRTKDVVYNKLSKMTDDTYINHSVRMMRTGEAADVTVHVEGVTFECHSALLQCYSDYFMAFNGADAIRLPEGSITANGFKFAYEWMQNDNAEPNRKYIVEMHLAARYLQMQELLAQLWHCFDDTKLFDEDTAFIVFLEARNYDIKMLQELMLTRISKFFLPVVASKEFLEFNEHEVIRILNSNYIGVNSEMEVFMSAIRWLSYDWELRKENAVRVLGCVRFNLMPAWFLTTLQHKQNCAIIQEVIAMPSIAELIQKGISYAIANQFIGVETPVHISLNMEKPKPRQWLIDESCKHHHKYRCVNWQHITFKAFNAYIASIIVLGGAYRKQLKYIHEKPCLSCCCDVKLNTKN